MSDRTKAILATIGLGMAIVLGNIAASHAEEIDKIPEEYNKTQITQNNAKKFRDSMKVGENASYNWENNTVQVQTQREIADEGR